MSKRTIVIVMTLVVFICNGCGLVSDDRKPVDDISKKIKEEMGNDLFFWFDEVLDDGARCYSFRVMKVDAGLIEDFYDACNEALNGEKEKTVFCVDYFLPGGGASLFYLQNYNDDGDTYDNVSYLCIRDQTKWNEEVCDPSLYSQIKGIKELHVDKGIQEKADDMGIDWYSYWPDLEKVVVEER